MTLGTGIFLSAVFLGLIALLIRTKERWSWKGLFLYPALVILIFGAMWALVDYGYEKGYYGPRKFGRETEYAGIKLRSTKDDVLFAKGKPTKEYPPDDDSGVIQWIYKENDDWLLCVYFGEDGLVRAVWAATHKKADSHSLPDLKFVRSYSDIEDFEERLGKAEFVENIHGGVSRIYVFPRYNLRVALEAREVRMISIVDYERYPYKPDQK